MVYPIQWLDNTFNSRSKTEQLLRPDLESGLITQHDYNLATSFLPGYNRYWPFAYGFGAGTGTALLARYKKWPWTSPRMFVASSLAGFFGAIYGQIRRAEAHLDFTRSLQNPTGFAKALENVNIRTGGVEPLGWTIPGAKREEKPEVQQGDASQPSEDAWGTDESRAVAPGLEEAQGRTSVPPSESTTTKSHSRWDEIRVTNARNAAKSSSWDALRQSHERDRVSESTRSDSNNDGRGAYTDEDRTLEQARFDALLEAERKISRE